MKPFLKFSAQILITIITIWSCDDEREVLSPANRLVALAGSDKSAVVNIPVNLDGSASYDGKKGNFQYSWAFKSKPAKSNATIINSRSVQSSFIPDQIGEYLLQLTIVQEAWSSSDELKVVVKAQDKDQTDSTVVMISSPITTPTILVDIFPGIDQPDYIVNCDLKVNADLTIMPGVVMAFQQDRGLEMVSGSLIAKGTVEKPIIFKGFGEGKGFWKGILIHSNSSLNEMQYALITQGGSSFFAKSNTRANLTIEGNDISGGAIRISNTAISDGLGYGFFLKGMSSMSVFRDNTFYGNVIRPAFISAGQLHNIQSGNSGLSEVETAGLVPANVDVTWKNFAETSYVIKDNIDIRGGVTVNPGTTFKIMDNVTIGISHDGYLRAEGTVESPIIFTSIDNSTFWNGLFFDSYRSHNLLSNTIVSNAGLNRMSETEYPSNIVVGTNGQLAVRNSLITNGLGYGLIVKNVFQVNQDLVDVNTFENLQAGSVWPDELYYYDKPQLEGAWMDRWSLLQGYNTVTTTFYNEETGIWFEGEESPWQMNGGFGIEFNADGEFIWVAAEHSQITGCLSYSAEYITGTKVNVGNAITFYQQYWRSKFINECQADQNVDMEVAPSEISLQYEITKVFDVYMGEEYWELKFFNLNGSTFSYFRK